MLKKVSEKFNIIETFYPPNGPWQKITPMMARWFANFTERAAFKIGGFTAIFETKMEILAKLKRGLKTLKFEEVWYLGIFGSDQFFIDGLFLELTELRAFEVKLFMDKLKFWRSSRRQ